MGGGLGTPDLEHLTITVKMEGWDSHDLVTVAGTWEGSLFIPWWHDSETATLRSFNQQTISERLSQSYLWFGNHALTLYGKIRKVFKRSWWGILSL